MDSQILFSDLADQSGILRAIELLQKANEKFGDSAVATNERISKSLAGLLTDLNKARESVSSFNNTQKGAGDKFGKINQSGQELITTYKSLNGTLAQNKSAVEANNRVIDQMQKRLAILQDEYEKLDFAKKEDTKRSKEIQRELTTTTRAVNGLSTATNSSSRSVRAAEGSTDALKQSVRDLKRQLDGLPDAYKKGTGQINEQNRAAVKLNQQYQQQVTLLGKIEKGQQIHTRNVGNYPKGGGALSSLGDLTGLGTYGTAAGVGTAIISAGSAIIEVGQNYERLALLTENALKNNKKAAAEANALIIDFANHSPAEIEEVTDAFNRLVTAGIIPTKEQLEQISDIAIAKRKTIMDYVEAIADAEQGQYRRLEEFGINASKSGDKVIFTYNGVRTVVEDNSKAISDYLINLGKVPGIMGATEKVAESFSGRWSTTKDAIKGVASNIFQLLLPALNAALWLLNKGTDKLGTFTAGLKALYAEGNRRGGVIGGAYGVAMGVLSPSTAMTIGRATQAAQASTGTSELDAYRKKEEIQQKINDANRKKAEAATKAQKDADKNLRESISNQKAASDQSLAANEAAQQDGLISERKFISERQRITISGINERLTMLRSAGKSETDDYKKLLTDKIDAQNQYKRDSLKLSLSESKADANKAIAGLAVDNQDGNLSDSDFAERKRGVMVASLNEQKAILALAGQAQSKLSQNIDRELLEVDTDYYREKLKIAKAAWKQELMATGEALREIDHQTAKEYDDQLVKINQFYNEKRKLVRGDVAAKKISQDEGDRLAGLLDINELRDQVQAAQLAYDKDQINSNTLTESKIQDLEKYKSASDRTIREIQSADEQIAALKKQREQDAANDKIALDKKKSDNAIAQSNKEDSNDEENKKKQKARREQLADAAVAIAQTLVDGLFDNQQQETQNKITALDKQQSYELSVVGDNEAAKTAIQQKYDAQRKALQRQEDVAAKNKAIFDIILNTAVSVSKVVANPILAFLVAGLGAVQLGLVLSRPLPAYFAGKNLEGAAKDTYAGPAWAGDRGREIWQHDGQVDVVDKPTIIDVGRTDVIYPNHITERLLRGDYAEGSQIMQRTARSRQLSGNLSRSRDNHQASLIARAMSGVGQSGNGVASEIKKGFEQVEVHQWHVRNGQLVDLVTTQHNRRNAQQKKHQLGSK
ncbi:hypothetical protein [Spirosoma spitsbergense]|uniref:hypothetical protein n=1 Tax=Spirosoma spitsbergense TaxID=431554 RepID=UPI0003700802|nr:hypothetical protein [Spirosoma spitsbergense]